MLSKKDLEEFIDSFYVNRRKPQGRPRYRRNYWGGFMSDNNKIDIQNKYIYDISFVEEVRQRLQEINESPIINQLNLYESIK